MIQEPALIPGPIDSPNSQPQPTNTGVKTGAGHSPLIRFRSNKEIEEQKAKEEAEKNPPVIEQFSPLTGHVRLAWDRNKLAKQQVSLRLLSALRARRGVYSAQELAKLQNNGTLNFIWLDITETKCRAASAWIREVLLPSGERPFMVKPSPMPDLPLEMKNGITRKAIQDAQQAMQETFQAGGGVMGPDEFRDLAGDIGQKLRDEIEAKYEKEANKAAQRMEDKIADDMAEGKWETAIDEFIEDFVTYPAAILKGPFYSRDKKLAWGPGYKPIVTNNPVKQWKRVSPFDAFPSPWSQDCQQGDFIERVRYFRKELYECIGLPGYNEANIRQALEQYTQGHLEGWLWTEAERAKLEQETLYTFLSPRGVIDGLSYWGSVQGWKLLDWGCEGIEDPLQEYEVNAILVGTYVIYCQVNPDPLGRRPYWKASYDAIPHAFWGRSVPDLAATPQKMANAAACALADNMGWSSGPMVWVHADRLADGENSIDIFPHKVWQLKSPTNSGSGEAGIGVGQFQLDSHSEELNGIIEKWELKADDSTGIPRYTYGNERVGGAADTYSGLSMLMNNAAKGLRRAISNIDINVIQQTVYTTFIYEMLWGKDKTLKCDAFISPRGASSILVKEAHNQARMTFLNIVTGNPALMQLVGNDKVAFILREVAKSLEISPDDAVPTEEEMKKAQQEALQQQQQQIQMQQQASNQQAQIEQQSAQEKLALEDKKIDNEQQSKELDASTRLAIAQIGHASKPVGIRAK